MATCPDCCFDYDIALDEHLTMCEARNCTLCWTTCDTVIDEDEDKDEDGNGARICNGCRDSLDMGGWESDSTEDEEMTDGIA